MREVRSSSLLLSTTQLSFGESVTLSGRRRALPDLKEETNVQYLTHDVKLLWGRKGEMRERVSLQTALGRKDVQLNLFLCLFFLWKHRKMNDRNVSRFEWFPWVDRKPLTMLPYPNRQRGMAQTHCSLSSNLSGSTIGSLPPVDFFEHFSLERIVS